MISWKNVNIYQFISFFFWEGEGVGFGGYESHWGTCHYSSEDFGCVTITLNTSPLKVLLYDPTLYSVRDDRSPVRFPKTLAIPQILHQPIDNNCCLTSSKNYHSLNNYKIILCCFFIPLIKKITISTIVIGLRNSYFQLIHLLSCYRTVCYRIACSVSQSHLKL